MAIYETFKNVNSIKYWVCSEDTLWIDDELVENNDKMNDTEFFKTKKEALDFMVSSPYKNLKCEDVKMGKIRAVKCSDGKVFIVNRSRQYHLYEV